MTESFSNHRITRAIGAEVVAASLRDPASIDDLYGALMEHQVRHPIIAHHPVTGRPYLNVSDSFTRFIIGVVLPRAPGSSACCST